jgi:hypothetical protein
MWLARPDAQTASRYRPWIDRGENVLDVTEDRFSPVIARVATRAGEAAYQIERLVECRNIIRREVGGRKKGKPHAAAHDWRALVDQGLKTALPMDAEEKDLEERARTEKAAALEQARIRERLSKPRAPLLKYPHKDTPSGRRSN